MSFVGRALATVAFTGIAVIPGATHLFPEAGALEQVIERSVAWLTRSLSSNDGRVSRG